MEKQRKSLCKAFICLLALAICSACASPNVSRPLVQNLDGYDILVKDGAAAATYIKKDSMRYCLEPLVDSVHSPSEGVSLGVGTVVNENVGFSESDGVATLGGMSPEVLIVSQLLYRACELSSNLNADADLTLKIYTQFLGVMERISSDVGTNVGSAALQSPPVQNIEGPKAYVQHRSGKDDNSGSTDEESDDLLSK